MQRKDGLSDGAAAAAASTVSLTSPLAEVEGHSGRKAEEGDSELVSGGAGAGAGVDAEVWVGSSCLQPHTLLSRPETPLRRGGEAAPGAPGCPGISLE